MGEPATTTSTHNTSPHPAEAKKSSFPAPITILVLVLIAVWIAAFLIPSGQYQVDASGSPIAGSFKTIPSPLDLGDRVRDLLLAPINGLYGSKILQPAKSAHLITEPCSVRCRCFFSFSRSAAS